MDKAFEGSLPVRRRIQREPLRQRKKGEGSSQRKREETTFMIKGEKIFS